MKYGPAWLVRLVATFGLLVGAPAFGGEPLPTAPPAPAPTGPGTGAPAATDAVPGMTPATSLGRLASHWGRR